jgi:hypothetical protein
MTLFSRKSNRPVMPRDKTTIKAVDKAREQYFQQPELKGPRNKFPVTLNGRKRPITLPSLESLKRLDGGKS